MQDLKNILSTRFFKKQRLLDDFHIKHENVEYWTWLSDLYENWLNQKAFKQIVPKKIHQIWLGSRLPKKYTAYQKSWQHCNPDFEYKLWSEKDILKIGLHNEKQYVLSKNYGVKSDIARYEILYRFGGIYADTDFECLKPFDDRYLSRSFVAGQVFSHSPQLANGLMIAASRDKFLELIIKSIPDHPGEIAPLEVLDYCGSFFISRLLWQNRKWFDDVLILPSQYFYPWPNYKIHNPNQRYQCVTEDSMAIHHWEMSWMQSSLRKRIAGVLRKILTGR
jgi:inositol phosphorylceramide mannosyltransferase catalytic subunit